MHVLLFCCIGTIGRPESGHSCPIKSRRLHRFIADNRDHKPTHASFQKQSQSHRHQFECFDLAVGVDDTDTPLAIPQYEMKERNQLPTHTSTVHPRTTTLAKQPFAISRAVAQPTGVEQPRYSKPLPVAVEDLQASVLQPPAGTHAFVRSVVVVDGFLASTFSSLPFATGCKRSVSVPMRILPMNWQLRSKDFR